MVLFFHLQYPSKVGLVTALHTIPGIVLDADFIGRSESALWIARRRPGNTYGNYLRSGARTGIALALAVIAIVIVVAGVPPGRLTSGR